MNDNSIKDIEKARKNIKKIINEISNNIKNKNIFQKIEISTKNIEKYDILISIYINTEKHERMISVIRYLYLKNKFYHVLKKDVLNIFYDIFKKILKIKE
jgi:small-conductance mechanosensitive channel